MSATTPALLGAAAGVGFGHAILPDHWVPLAVVGRTRRLPLSRVARLSGLAGVAHVIVSIALGGIVIAVGLQFRSRIESAQNLIIGLVLIATGVGFGVLELSGPGHSHSHAHGDAHENSHENGDHHVTHGHSRAGLRDVHDRSEAQHGSAEGARWTRISSVMVPFGAAASPDLTILPVFLAATTAGVAAAVGALVVFSVVTIATFVGLTLFATFGGYQVQGRWLDRWGNMFTAVVLLAIGALVLGGVI